MVFLTTLMMILCSCSTPSLGNFRLNSVFDKSMYLGKSPLRLSFYVNSRGIGRESQIFLFSILLFESQRVRKEVSELIKTIPVQSRRKYEVKYILVENILVRKMFEHNFSPVLSLVFVWTFILNIFPQSEPSIWKCDLNSANITSVSSLEKNCLFVSLEARMRCGCVLQ